MIRAVHVLPPWADKTEAPRKFTLNWNILSLFKELSLLLFSFFVFASRLTSFESPTLITFF